ncbi:MAG: Uma2 family endonuclease [Bacteroidia bacterium]
MAVLPVRRLVSVEDYHRMAEAGILTERDRVELIDGEIINMGHIESKCAGHVNKINAILSRLLKKSAVVSVQNPVHLNNFSEPEPDIAVLRPSPDFYISHHPRPEDIHLVIEVSDSSLNWDRENKLPMYAAAGIKECWLIDIAEQEIEIYRTPSDRIYKYREIARENDTITLSDFDLTISVNDIL